MPSPEVLDVAALIEPIPGANPAGDEDYVVVDYQLKELRQEFEPGQLMADDPRSKEPAKKADWPAVAKLAQECLRTRSKSLKVAAYLTEALVKLHGFAGGRDGLALLRGLVEQAWDRIHPAADETGDVSGRASLFVWLANPDRDPMFPNTLRSVPLLKGGNKAFSWMDWHLAQLGRAEATMDEITGAARAMSRENGQLIVDDIKKCEEQLNQLDRLLGEKLKDDAPNLESLQKALEDNRRLVEELVLPGTAGTAAPIPGEEPGPDGAARVPAASREEAYRQLTQAAAVLRQLEPHSPIPYLVERAVTLGKMSWPELIQVLIRNPEVLAELTREFGLPKPE